jgi:8-oxo-dGTP diphosphatase
MLPANAPVLAALALPAEYAITDSRRFGLAAIERGLKAGLKLLQVREPELPPAERERFTRQVIHLAHQHGCKVLTKMPFEGADGVHVTAQQLMRLQMKSGLTAASCHTRRELERAMNLGLDFAVLGPVKEKAAIGWAAFAELIAGASLPVYAIGGLRRADLEDAWRAGAHGVAMIRGAWS